MVEDVQRQDEIELHPIQIEDRAFLDRDRNVGKLGYPAEEAGVLRVAFHRGDLEPQPRQAEGEESPVRSYVERCARAAVPADARTVSNRCGGHTEGMFASCGWLIGA